MNAHASTLDTDKLRKFKALMEGGKTLGERQAAKRKAETLATRAGLTLWQAMSKLDAPVGIVRTASPSFADIFGAMEDEEERKNPGHKARQAKERAEKEAKRRARCDALAAQYGSLEAVFEDTEIEAALREALAHLEDPANRIWGYEDYRANEPTPAMWEAIRAAVHVPTTLPELLALHRAQEALGTDRYTVDDHWTPGHWSEAWRGALEHLLDTLADPTAEGVAARIDWMLDLAKRDFSRGAERDEVVLAALKADFAILSVSVQTGQPQPQTETQRRAAVLDLLRQHFELTDREIARRTGVSPTTVGKQRRKMERSHA
ncbi:hypothetical protein HOY34_11170 [Xinfangfangia sp. D13-10-4-6]|uniref:helix-turn-helix domain-containing protein n=1 Tax=Pseudogemmobacter hezensis TaxID=2737662 RepID=UPI001552BBB2|nr:helix-turn-helix domain-containing protein [Pseudogemmobacter hezensis]NPD15763.1 hypothetical protein [Pseudogemmobacter hezensis]